MAAPLLFVIARGNTEQYDLARRHFGGDPAVEVVYDRRVVGERRAQRAGRVAVERRLADRRQSDISEDLELLGWAYIRRAG